MQRLFSMFPHGLPGVGLLLLRAAVALPLFDDMCSYWPSLTLWIVCAYFLLMTGLVLGIATPVACMIALAVHSAAVESPHLAQNLLNPLTAVSLALLGPGAFSFDAHLFGRRQIILPSDTDDAQE